MSWQRDTHYLCEYAHLVNVAVDSIQVHVNLNITCNVMTVYGYRTDFLLSVCGQYVIIAVKSLRSSNGIDSRYNYPY